MEKVTEVTRTRILAIVKNVTITVPREIGKEVAVPQLPTVGKIVEVQIEEIEPQVASMMIRPTTTTTTNQRPTERPSPHNDSTNTTSATGLIAPDPFNSFR